MIDNMKTKMNIKPFLKWAGGKSQLLNEIEKYYPFNDNIKCYVEPFVGGGAIFFDVIEKFDLDRVVINDINSELMNAYKAIKNDVKSLIAILEKYQSEYIKKDFDARTKYYNEKRKLFNEMKLKNIENVESAALLIFLNKTCFNGLYRVNRKGEYNVPMGKYKNPMICDTENLQNISRKLKNVTILTGDFDKTKKYIDDKTFVYLDPPYRPLTKTQSFTSYTENCFSDERQIELANFIKDISKIKAKVLLSNSDPKNEDVNDNFFDNLYSGFKIKRVEACRMINCNGEKRGKIKELLISNF